MFSIISSLKLATVLQTLLFSSKLSSYLVSRCKEDNFQVSVPLLVSRRTISMSWSLAIDAKPRGCDGARQARRDLLCGDDAGARSSARLSAPLCRRERGSGGETAHGHSPLGLLRVCCRKFLPVFLQE